MMTSKSVMSNRFEWDDTNSSGIWWSTNVGIRDECILLKEDTKCEDSDIVELLRSCLLYTSPSPRDSRKSRMPSSA